MADIDVLNPSEQSRFTLIGPDQLGQRTRQFIEEADSLEATFYSLERVDPYILKLLQQKGPLGRFIVNYGQKEASDVGPLERQIQILRDTGAEVTEFSEPTRRQRTHSKVYVSEDEFLVSTANPSVGFDQVPNINTFRPSPLRRLGALLGMDSQREIRQINYGITSRDAGLREELRSILNTVRGNEFSLSTDNFITGGRESRSADVIVSRIDQVKKGETILFGSAYMDDPRIVLALAQAEGRGVDVKGMVNNPDTVYERARGGQEELVRGGLQYLASKGVTLYAPRRTDALKQHSKFMVLGEEGVIVGSHNFTQAADRDSAEISLSVNDRDLADQFRVSFEGVIKNYGLQNLYPNFRPNTRDKGFLNFQQAAVKVRMNQMGISNPNFAYLGTQTHADDLRVPSALPSSYFYARSLYNATQYRERDYVSVLRTQEVFRAESAYRGALGSQYEMAVLLQRGRPLNTGELPNIFIQYDLALEQGSFGDSINELTVRLGWGRLYKSEVGLFPSVLGTVGRVLDSTISYYGADVPDFLLQVNQIDQVRIQDRPPGPFESLLTGISENVISSMFSIFTYLITSLPAAVITSKTIGSLMDSALQAVHDTRATSLQKYAVKGSSKKTLSEIAEDPSFYKTGFNFYSFQYNLMRRPGQIMFDYLIRPIIEDIISPFEGGTAEAAELREALDRFSDESGRTVRMMTENQTFQYKNMGFEREQNLAKSFDRIGDRIPLNPLNWKIIRGKKPVDPNYLRVSDVFRLEDAVIAIERILNPRGILSLVPRFLSNPSLSDVIGALDNNVQNSLVDIQKRVKAYKDIDRLDRHFGKSLKELEILENNLIGRDVLQRVGRDIVSSGVYPDDPEFNRYKELLQKQKKILHKTARKLASLRYEATSPDFEDKVKQVEEEFYSRASNNKSTISTASAVKSKLDGTYRDIGGRPPKMFLRQIGLSSLLILSIELSASFVLDNQGKVPQLIQMLAQKRIDKEELGIDTQITPGSIVQLPKELDFVARMAYVSGAFALGSWVDSKVNPFQTDWVQVDKNLDPQLRIRGRRSRYSTAGGLTTIAAILFPSAVEQTLAGVRKLTRFVRNRTMPNPIASQGQVTASNLALAAQRLNQGSSFDEIQAAHQADKLASMMSFTYAERTRGTAVIAVQAPTPFFQPFFTLSHRGYRETEEGRMGGTYYFSVGIQGPSALGIGTNLELPFGITTELDEEGNRRGSLMGLVYNPNDNTVVNYFSAVAQVFAATTGVSAVLRYGAALISNPKKLDQNLKAVDDILGTSRILNNLIQFPLFAPKMFYALGAIGKEASEGFGAMAGSLLKDVGAANLLPNSIKKLGKAGSFALAGAAAGYLLSPDSFISVDGEELISPQALKLTSSVIGIGLGSALYLGLRASKTASTATSLSISTPVQPQTNLFKSTKKGLIFSSIAAAGTALIVTDPDFEFMRPLEGRLQENILHRVGVGIVIGGLTYAIPYRAAVEVTPERVNTRLLKVEEKLAQLSENGSPLNRLNKARLLEKHQYLSRIKENVGIKHGIGIRYTEELNRRAAPLVFGYLALSLIEQNYGRPLEAIPFIGAVLQDSADILRGGRRVNVEPLLRRGLSSPVLVTRDGRSESVVSVDPRFVRQASRQPILRAISRAYYSDAPNPFLPVPLTPFGLTFRSRADGMISTPYLQFQAASVDISLSESFMTLMSQYSQRSVLSGGYDTTFDLMQIHQMSAEQQIQHIIHLTASIAPLSKRRSISRPSEIVINYMSKDPLLSYIIQDRSQNAARSSYQRPESLYMGMENEAWQIIKGQLSFHSLKKMSPQQRDKLIQNLVYPGGMTQSFDLVPNSLGLGRLRRNSDKVVEDLLMFSSPFYEDAVRPLENRYLEFLDLAFQGTAEAVSFSPVLGWAALALIGSFGMLGVNSLFQLHSKTQGQKINTAYAKLQERFQRMKDFRNSVQHLDTAVFGSRSLRRYQDSGLLENISRRENLVRKLRNNFIDEVLGLSPLNPTYKSLSDYLTEVMPAGDSLQDAKFLSNQIQLWLDQRIEGLFKIPLDAGLDTVQSEIHKAYMKNKFKEAVEKVMITEKRGLYKIGSFFFRNQGATTLDVKIISDLISFKFLEEVEQPLKNFYSQLGGLLTGESEISDLEALHTIKKAPGAIAEDISSSASIARVRSAKEARELHQHYQAIYGKSGWSRFMKTAGSVAGVLSIAQGAIEGLGTINMGMRLSAAYSEDTPSGYINNLVESWSRDFLMSTIYQAGGLFNRPVLFMAGVFSLSFLDNFLSRYEPYREVSKKLKDSSLHFTSQTYKSVVENLSIGFIEEEDVAFGITSVSTIGTLSATAGLVSFLFGLKNMTNWLTHPFQEVGKRATNWGAKLTKFDVRSANKVARKVAGKGRGDAAILASMAALGIILVGAASAAASSIIRNSYEWLNPEGNLYRSFSRVTQAVTNSVEDRIPFIRMFMPHPMDYLNGYRANSSQNPFLVASPDDAIKMEYLQMLSSAGQDFGGGSVSYFVSSEVYGIPNRYSRESKIISQAFEGMGPHRLLDPLLDRMLMMRGQEFDNRVIGQMNWRALIRRAANHRELKKALDNTRESARARRTNTNSTARRLSEDYNIVLYAAALLKPSSPSPETEAIKISFAEVPRNTNYDQAALAVEAATGRGQAGSRDVKVRDLGPGNGFEVDITPSQNHLVELAATQYRARQNTMQPTA